MTRSKNRVVEDAVPASKYNSLKEQYDKLKETIDGIQSVLDKYFEDGNSSDYNPYYSAQDAIDDIDSWL